MKKLTIAIPTFNRAEALATQLDFLLLETANFKEDVEIVIFDNHSTDETQKIAENHPRKEEYLYLRNERNLGLVGNFCKIIEWTSTPFVWIVGDDDKIDPGILNLILPNLKKDRGLMHLNHRCIDGRNDELLIPRFYEHHYASNHIDSLSQMLKDRHHGGLMWITANIYETKAAKQTLKQSNDEEIQMLAYPFFFAAKIAIKHGFTFISEVKLSCFYHVSSWIKHYENIERVEIPFFTNKLTNNGLPKKIAAFLIARQRNFKINPLKMPFYITFYEPRSIFNYFKWKLKKGFQ